ncbi:MAG: hypothetical protein QOH31_4288 [Verrucomicrobiota bacterium]
MFSSPVDYQKPNTRRVAVRSLRNLNAGILGFAMTAAITLLVATPGNIGRVISAFDDPFLIDYANQQGLDMPGSATLLNNSNESPVPSRSPSSQSSRFSSSY